MSDMNTDAGEAASGAATPSATPAPSTPVAPASTAAGESSYIVHPIGKEFEVAVHHQSIAEKLGVEIKDVFFEIETAIERGVHRLIGTKKPAAAPAAPPPAT
jgi:hypothetical protein